MLTRFLHIVSTFGPFSEMDADAIKALKSNFPPLVSRRMTKPALMLGACLKDQTIDPADAVIFTTTYSETMCLEKYLDSFPTPSPLMFQNSIHPSGIEQLLIARKQPVEEFMSFAGDNRLVHSALVAAFVSETPRQWIVGTEEIGTWLTEHKRASDVDFAYAILLSSDSANAVAKIEWRPQSVSQDTPETDLDFLKILDHRMPCRMKAASLGELELTWLS